MDTNNSSMPTPQPATTQEGVFPNPPVKQGDTISPPPKSNKKYIIISFAVLTLAVLAFAFFFISNRKSVSQITPTSSPTRVQIETNPVDIWTQYTNRTYFYSIAIPPYYAKLKANKAEGGTEEYIEYSKGEGSTVSKIRILMTSSKAKRDEIANLKEKLKDRNIGEEVAEAETKFSKVYLSDFTAYKTVSENNGYSVTLLVEKNKWIYQFNLESTDIADKQILEEVASKIKIFDSETQFNVDNPS